MSWEVDPQLKRDPCIVWLAQRHGEPALVLRDAPKATQPSSAPNHQHHEALERWMNDVAVCQDKHWSHQTVVERLLPLEVDGTPTDSRGEQGEMPMLHYYKRSWDHSGSAATSSSSPNHAVVRRIASATHSGGSQAVRMHVGVHQATSEGVAPPPPPSIRLNAIATTTTHDAPPQQAHICEGESSSSSSQWLTSLPPLSGYIHVPAHDGDTIRYLLIPASTMTSSCTSTTSSATEGNNNGGCNTTSPSSSSVQRLVPWKVRGSASWLQRFAYMHLQWWPQSQEESSSGSTSSSSSWWSSVAVKLHTNLQRRSLDPLIVSTPTTKDQVGGDASNVSSYWMRHWGAAVDLHTALDPRIVFQGGVSLQHPWPFATSRRHTTSPVSEGDKTRSSSDDRVVCTPSIGVSWIGAPQQSTRWRTARTTQWSCNVASPFNLGGHANNMSSTFSCGSGYHRVPLEVSVSGRGVMERLWHAPRLILGGGQQAVTRLRWVGAAGNGVDHVEVPDVGNIVRGATLCPIPADNTSTPSPPPSSSPLSLKAQAFGALSIETQFVRLISGMDVTLFINALGLYHTPPTSPSHSRSQAMTTGVLYSAGYALHPTQQQHLHSSSSYKQQRVSQWNQWIPQRLECYVPGIRGGGGFGGGDGDSRNASPYGVSWLPKCGVVWDLS